MDANKPTAERLVDYDGFLKWLEEKEHLEGRSSKEWEAAHPGCGQAIWRSGMWYAFREATQALPRFVINPHYTVKAK